MRPGSAGAVVQVALWAAFVVFACANAGVALAQEVQEVVIFADADVAVYSAAGDGNFGDAADLDVEYASSRVDSAAFTLLHFDVASAVPAGATIESAVMELYLTAASGVSEEILIGAYSVTSPWSENIVDWNTRPESQQIGIVGWIDLSANSYKSWNVTSYARSWLEGRNYGLELRGPLTEPDYSRTFQSREVPRGHAPRLTVAYRAGALLELPEEPLFIGEYRRVPVRIAPGSGLSFEDLDFRVVGGSAGGLVSVSRDAEFDPANPSVLLLAGYEPGPHEVQVVRRADDVVVAEASFEITPVWPDDDLGPSFWLSDRVDLSGAAAAGAAWGGGGSDPENYNVIPALGTRNVAVLFVDTQDQRFTPTETEALIDTWKDAVADGVLVNGKTVSTAQYYQEVSYGKLTMAFQFFGPVELPGVWSDYYQTSGQYKGSLWQACATAGDSLIDFRNFDSLACVSRSVTSGTMTAFAWPYADAAIVKVGDCEAGGKCDVSLGVVSMPVDWETLRPGRHIYSTLAHELGHNLGLGDIYPWNGHTLAIQQRALGGWALMADENQLPHMVLVHRMKLGWLPKENLKLYNFQSTSPATVNETITLHPVELGALAGGRYSGIEIRIAPGWDYYCEYRTAQSTQVGDQGLPVNDRVLCTDVSFDETYYKISHRKPVMLQREDSDGDGPVLGNGQDYREQDTTDPAFPTDFSISVSGIDGDKADVTVRYGVTSKPDPSIRPWDTRVWQSPDIEVRNARAQANPDKWFNMPWGGHINQVVAKVNNRGKLNAPQVRVEFYVKDMTLNGNGTPEFFLGAETKDIAAGQTVEFSADWLPGPEGHHCILARIPIYQLPTAPFTVEMTEFNNRAQSNYTNFISATASPPSREMTWVNVHNPYEEPARVRIRVAQNSNPLYRVFFQNRWIRLDPGQTLPVQVMFEYAGEDNITEPYLEPYIRKPDDVRLYATIDPPAENPEQVQEILGGARIMVFTGRATRFASFGRRGEDGIHGSVVTVDDGQPVPGGRILLMLRRNVEGEAVEECLEADLNPDTGSFVISAGQEWLTAAAYYDPLDGYGDCSSEPLQGYAGASGWRRYQ